MRRFQFRLATVLRHRETIEGLREQDFVTAQGMVATVETRIRELQAEFRRVVSERPGHQGEPFDAHAIGDRERYLETLLVATEQQQRHLQAARIVLEETRRVLTAAKQARQVVSRLKDKDLAIHTALALQMEQDVLDELATLRYTREQETGKREERKEDLNTRTPEHLSQSKIQNLKSTNSDSRRAA